MADITMLLTVEKGIRGATCEYKCEYIMKTIILKITIS